MRRDLPISGKVRTEGGKREKDSTLQLCANSHSTRYQVDINLGVVFKITRIYSVIRHVESEAVGGTSDGGHEGGGRGRGGEKCN